jgi:hypothetical protein
MFPLHALTARHIKKKVNSSPHQGCQSLAGGARFKEDLFTEYKNETLEIDTNGGVECE